MSVIDRALRVPQYAPVLTHDEILAELIRRLEAGDLKGRSVANALGIAPARVTEMKNGQRRIQPREMPILAEKLGMIAKSEVLAGAVEVTPNDMLAPRYHDLPRDVPAYGTALGTFVENEAIEQTIINYDGPIDFFLRPPGVARREGIYGLYVSGESQSPRFRPGELIFVDPKRTPMIGDDVVVYLKQPDGDGEALGAILLKQLSRRSHSSIELHQLNPDMLFQVDARKVLAIHRVLTTTDLYGGYR